MEGQSIIKEHIQWRRQIRKLARADLIKTYSGAALGWAWAVIRPAITIFVYWFAFGMGLREKAGIEGWPFILWLMAGIISWFYIRDMLNSGTMAMRTYKHLITKMKFPVSTIPTFVSLANFTVHLVLVLMVIIIFILFGYWPTLYYLQVPFYMLLMFIFATAWGLFGSVLAAMSKDFANLIKTLTMAFFWLSGIMFPVSEIDIWWAQLIFKLNPITYIVEGYRNCFIHQVWFWEEPAALAVYLAEMLIMILLAVYVYNKMRKDLPDVL